MPAPAGAGIAPLALERIVIPIVSREPAVNPAYLPPMLRLEQRHGDAATIAAATYYRLAGCDPADAEIADDDGFDRHVLASILAVAATADGIEAERTGLSAADLGALLAAWFPLAGTIVSASGGPTTDDDEIVMVRDLLLAQRSSTSEAGRLLPAMIARRAMEPNHLWEDLGLRDRSELSRLLARHFAPLAVRNTRNMRWKRFFYRMLCEDDGLVMCSTPVCSNCNDFQLCFGDESGESRMAERRREVARQGSYSAALEPLMLAAE